MNGRLKIDLVKAATILKAEKQELFICKGKLRKVSKL
jgi:hypothetical protein